MWRMPCECIGNQHAVQHTVQTEQRKSATINMDICDCSLRGRRPHGAASHLNGKYCSEKDSFGLRQLTWSQSNGCDNTYSCRLIFAQLIASIRVHSLWKSRVLRVLGKMSTIPICLAWSASASHTAAVYQPVTLSHIFTDFEMWEFHFTCTCR